MITLKQRIKKRKEKGQTYSTCNCGASAAVARPYPSSLQDCAS